MYCESEDLPMHCPYSGAIIQWTEDTEGGYRWC